MMTEFDKEDLRDLVKQSVREAVREETMFFTQTCINLTARVGKLEGRSDVNSIRVRSQASVLQKLSSGRAQLVYHAITLITILATYYAK